MKPDGTRFEVYARGIRNTVGFDWDPATKELWFTDNGRDWMGDDTPPDELNRAPSAGMHFGYPWCHGGDVKDPEFGKERPCSDFTPPALKLPAARRGARDAVLHGHGVSRRVPRPDLHRRARLVEPQDRRSDTAS